MTNAGFIDANTADGLRKCLVDEFSSLYIFHLRGNQRTSGEKSRQEGGKIFGSGSRAPIAISILVKNPDAEQLGKIYFHDIGDYLSREEKLNKISKLKSLIGITNSNGWSRITPDDHGDWLNQRDDSFYQFISLGDKKDKTSIALFENYSRGLETNRDAWCYNFSRTALSLNIDRTLNFYNSEVDRFVTCDENMKIEDFLDMDLTKISWNRSLKKDLERNKKYHYDAENLVHSLYRPFSKSWVYCAGGINAYLNQIPKIFPKSENFNKLIYCSGAGNSGKEFSTIITDKIPDLNMQHSGGQGFPLFIYDEQKNNSEDINATQRNATQHYTTETQSNQNFVICISTMANREFSVLISDSIPDVQLQANGQCFPLYLYEMDKGSKQ